MSETPSRLSCAATNWETPQYLLDRVRAYFGGPIPLDPATSPLNPTKALAFYTPANNGLALPWNSDVFINPPYGKELPAWFAKVAEEAKRGTVVIALYSLGGGRSSCPYWHAHVLTPELRAVAYVRGRISFIDPSTGKPENGNNYPSGVYGYNVDADRFISAFQGNWPGVKGRGASVSTVAYRVAHTSSERT